MVACRRHHVSLIKPPCPCLPYLATHQHVPIKRAHSQHYMHIISHAFLRKCWNIPAPGDLHYPGNSLSHNTSKRSIPMDSVSVNKNIQGL